MQENLYKHLTFENNTQFYNKNELLNPSAAEEELLKYIPDKVKPYKFLNYVQNYISLCETQKKFIRNVFIHYKSLIIKGKLENIRNNQNTSESPPDIIYPKLYELYSEVDDNNFSCDSIKFYIINESDFLKYFDYNDFSISVINTE